MGASAPSIAGMYEYANLNQHKANKNSMWDAAYQQSQADSDMSRYSTNPFSSMPTGEDWENLTELSQDYWKELQDRYSSTGLIPGMNPQWKEYDNASQLRAKKADYLKNNQYGYAVSGGQESAFPGAITNNAMAGMPKNSAPADYYSTVYAPEGYWDWQFPNLLNEARLWQKKGYESDYFDNQAFDNLEAQYNRYYTPPEYSYNIQRPSMAKGGSK